MSDTVISVQNLWKEYRLGTISHHSMARDLQSWWARVRGKDDPNALVDIAVDSSLKRKTSNLKPEADRFWALKDVNFDVKRGEVLGIIGRNGAGKSTLLKILSRVTTPSRGGIKVTGRIASLLEVGTGFHPELTGRENVFLNGSILGMSKTEIRRKFDEIVDFAEIEKFIDTPVKRYSSGMYVRLAFGVAAHLEPDILICDEVLAVGDAAFQKKCLGKMKQVGSEGRTVLFVSHNMASIAGLCTAGLHLSTGSVTTTGDITTVISRYLETLGGTGHERVWRDPAEAPGDDTIRLKGVRIVQDGESTGNVSIDNEVVVEIDYWNFRPETLVTTSIHLKGRNEVEVLATANMSSATLGEDPWFGRPQPPGLYCARCVFPPNFLNEENYTVNAIVLTDISRMHVKVDDVVSFKAHDTGEMRKEFSGGWLGVVRPRLAWETELVEEGVRAA